MKETTFNDTSCPGYERGNPSNRNMTGCETGTSLEAIDLEKAFGFNSDKNPDWNACGLPRLPEEKYVHEVFYSNIVFTLIILTIVINFF